MAADMGQPVKKYEVTATFRDGVVAWTFGIMTDDGKTYRLDVRDGEEIPQLMDVCRRDWTIYFDPQTQTLSSGWNIPGSKETGGFR